MALSSWKAFRYFDVSPVQLQNAEGLSLFTEKDVTAKCASADVLFAGTSDGDVHLITKAFRIARSFQAHEHGSITQMKQLPGTSLLVTVAEDLSNEPTLKVWALDKLEKKTNSPRCLSTLTIQNNRQQHPITAFAALDDLSQLAFGFANGAVTVVRGDLIHDRGAKQRTVFESKEPITGVEFREGNTTALFIGTISRILKLVISGRGQGQPARILDDNGCSLGCMTLDTASRDIIVARDDAIHYYGLHGRGSSFNCDGHKTLLSTHKDYILFSCPANTSSLSRSSVVGSYNASSNADLSRMSMLVILNTDFHFIAHAETLPAEFSGCFTAWGDLFVITIDNKLYRYHEKPLQQRLDILFQRNLYVLAIQIAQQSGVDTNQQNLIFRKYGDYLYQKKDYDTAMQQYLRAIDGSEPSTIIRKYLGTQRIHNLIDYLEELHEHHKATSDHTILLLNCYAKLKDVDKLEAFIKQPGDSTFDVDTAISMCRQGGYFDQAAYLARKHQEHDVVVSVLVEDLKKYAEALAYIWRLEAQLAYANLLRYANVLIAHCPEEATQIFIDYYTARFRPKQDAIVVSTTSSNTQQQQSFAYSAVQSLAAILPLPYMSMSSKDADPEAEGPTQTRIVESTNNDAPIEYEVPKPRTAFSAFVDHPVEFTRFLEACVAYEGLKEDDRIDLYTTLFEMYLRRAKEAQDDATQKAAWEDKARELIESSNIPIDKSNVLLLSTLTSYATGTTLIKEQQALYTDIFRSYTTAHDTAGAITALHKYGPLEPALYPAALTYFTSSPSTLSAAGPEFDAVLRKIEQDRLMSPLQVIQTLSQNSTATMGLVKRYLHDTVAHERAEIEKNKHITATYRADTVAKRAQLEELETRPATFKATRCSACHYALDQPIVHFFCQHSFHQRCLNVPEVDDVGDGAGGGASGGGGGGGEMERSLAKVECPHCGPSHATVRALRRAQEESRGKHEVFMADLERAPTGERFGIVAGWLGRGALGGGGEN